MRILFILLLLASQAFSKANGNPNGPGIIIKAKGQLYEIPPGTVCLITGENANGVAGFVDLTGNYNVGTVGSPTTAAVPGAVPSGVFPTGTCFPSLSGSNYLYLTPTARGGLNTPYRCTSETHILLWRNSNTASNGVSAGFFGMTNATPDATQDLGRFGAVAAGAANNGAVSMTANLSGTNLGTLAPYLFVAGEWFDFCWVQSSCQGGFGSSNKSVCVWAWRSSTNTWSQVKDTAVPAATSELKRQDFHIGYNRASSTNVSAGNWGSNVRITDFWIIRSYRDATIAPSLPWFHKVNFSLETPSLWQRPLLACQ